MLRVAASIILTFVVQHRWCGAVVQPDVATIHDSAGAGASGNGSNGQALTADMTQISKKLQHWAEFMFAWIRC